MSEQELNDLKQVLHSLVIPYPEGLSLRQLCNDYRDVEGQMIPYQAMGFSSVTALMKSMPDRIRMIGNISEINSVVLYPVKSETTKHIIDLVQKQNKCRKKSRKTSNMRFSSWNRFAPTPRPLSRSANTHRNDLQIDALNTMTNTLNSDLFLAYYKYFDALSQSVIHSKPSNISDPLTPLLLNTSNNTNPYNQNINHFSRPNVQNSSSNWRPLLPMVTSNLPSTPINSGYTSKTVIDYSDPTPNMSSNVNSKVISLGQRFLDFRITKTLNKLNEKQSKPTQSITQSRSPTGLHIVNKGLSAHSAIFPSNSSKTLSVPNKLKDNIRLMMSSPDIEEGFMLFNFEARYRHQFKESFDYKSYGFQTLTDCLKTLPDVLEMVPTGTKTYKLMPLHNSPQIPKTKSTAVPTTTTVITNGNSIAMITSTPTSTTLTFVTTQSTMTTTIVSTTNKKLFTVPPSAINKKADCSSQTAPSAQVTGFVISSRVPKPAICPILTQKVIKSMDESMDNQSVCSFASNDSNIINNKAKQNFRTILLFHENGVNALDFASEYEKYFKVKFDSRIWGFKSHMELFHGLPQIFAIQVNEKNEEILHDSRFKKFEPKPKPAVNKDLNTKFLLRQIPDLIFARILRLIQMSAPLGLSLTDFMAIYDNKYESIGSTLRQLRFSDAFELFELIRDETPIVIKSIDGQKRAFVKSKEELSEWTVRQTRVSRFIIPITLVDTPSNVVLPGEHFRPIQLPERFKSGNYEYVAVYISSAVNPHEIYIQFKGAEYHTALENLMSGLDFYENAPKEQWVVPFEFLYVGYPVVCRYPGDKNWHRARISRIHAMDKRVVTVAFVDYGGTHVLDFKNLRLMKKEFVSLPVQALKVGLYGIKPILGNKPSDWTASARDKLLRFSKPQYALACTLIEVRPDNHWVAICDTNTTLDVFLHLVLVNDKHALLNDDNDVKENPYNTSIENNYFNRPIAQMNGF